ncbi:hypothetical protein, conserved [Leishmania tarentolae]|uniref:Uncharacterized protein n=1 Tax=Leishmania tarentolae TaxID=5689 RepID=A0A640KG40_LEITA|nr:hypothetical protein, conserved [Leishmania tarentolae]
MNTSEKTLSDSLASPHLANECGSSAPSVICFNGNGSPQKHVSNSQKNLSNPSVPSLPEMWPLVKSERHLTPVPPYANVPSCNGRWPMSSGPKMPIINVNELNHAPPHMSEVANGNLLPKKPPLPPSAVYSRPPSGRPAPQPMQNYAPPHHTNLSNSLKSNGAVKQSAICGSSGLGNAHLLANQILPRPCVMSVARGPQPTSVEPTRLPNGKKIHHVDRQKLPSGEARPTHKTFTGPSKSAMIKRKEQLYQKKAGANVEKPINTTAGNDNSWMKGLTYSTWVDSPKGNLKEVDNEAPYKRQPKNKAPNTNTERKDVTNMGKASFLLEALRNLFR